MEQPCRSAITEIKQCGCADADKRPLIANERAKCFVLMECEDACYGSGEEVEAGYGVGYAVFDAGKHGNRG